MHYLQVETQLENNFQDGLNRVVAKFMRIAKDPKKGIVQVENQVENPTSVLVVNLSSEITMEILRDFFGYCGAITGISILQYLST